MIENKKIIRFALFFILSCCLLIPQDAPAQYRQAHTVVHSSIFFQTWKITEDGSEKKLTQWALPFFLSRTFGSRLQLMLAESNAISLLDLPDGAKWPSQDPLSFGGIGDTKIKLSYGLVPNKLLITSGLSLPTGKNALSIPESKIFRQFSSETLAFRVTSKNLPVRIENAVVFGDVELAGLATTAACCCRQAPLMAERLST